MDFDEIPHDVWIEIFERVDDPYPLAVLMRTCQLFRALARRPLLREIRWMKHGSTQRNIDAWKGVYNAANVHMIPRKLIVGVSFDYTARPTSYNPNLTPENRLHDAIWRHLPRFTALNELVLEGTMISFYSYTVFAQMPALRTLHIQNCSYIHLPVSFQENAVLDFRNREQLYHTPFPFATLPLTHLSLHKVNGNFESAGLHPINLIAAANLASLAVTWTGGIAQAYASTTTRPQVGQIGELDVTMPVLTRDLVDALVNFVEGCTAPSGPPPSIKLAIERHNLSDQQIGAVQVPLANVWSYQGPLSIASFGNTRQMVVGQGANARLRRVVMNEPLDLGSVLDGLERLPRGMEVLEVMVRKWDVELLFAIRELFPGIESLVIRYGRGNFASDFFVTLGANILFDLPKLTTLKLFHDPSCVLSTRQMNNVHPFGTYHTAPGAGAGGGPPVFFSNFSFDDDQHEAFEGDALFSSSSASGSGAGVGVGNGNGNGGDGSLLLGIEGGDLKDYLIGWNRYCRRLRHVQLGEGSVWERKFEGDVWREVGGEE